MRAGFLPICSEVVGHLRRAEQSIVERHAEAVHVDECVIAKIGELAECRLHRRDEGFARREDLDAVGDREVALGILLAFQKTIEDQ